MRKLFTILALTVLSAGAHAEVWQARYGVAETFDFKLYNADGTLDVDEADGGTEVSLACNEGAETTATNDFVDEGTFYSIALTATEMQCERITVVVAATLTEVFFIQTSANASAMTPTYEANVASVTTGAIDNADFATAPGASGGLLISGSNSGTTTLGALTITGATTHTGATVHTGAVTMAAGLAITQSAANTAGLSVTGNGTGNGATFTSGSGATGNGISVTAASTNGNGLAATGTGTGSGLIGTGGATGDGLEGVGGGTSGAGLRAAGTAGNSPAATLVGQGSAAGLLATGGSTGHGISAVGGATSGSGISSVASTSGAGIIATGVGTTQAGIAATGGSTSSAGISATGGGTGSGILATSGGGATGNGITVTAASTNGHGISSAGVGTGSGVLSTGGATGHGMRLVGGSTSGNGLSTAITAPSAGAPELGFAAAGTLSGTHSSTTADLGTNAPGTVSDIVGHALVFPTRHASRTISAYDTTTGVATWATALDADITLTNADPWLLFETAPGSGSTDVNVVTIEGTDATNVLGTAQTGDAYARLGAPVGASVSADIADIRADIPAALVSGRIDASVGAMAANVLTATAVNADAFTAAKFATDVGTEFANATWALDATGQQTQGSFGQVLGDSGATAASIWSLANTNLNATVSSRASQTSVDAVDDFVDTEITAIKTKTDFLPSATAGAAGGLFIAGSNAATSITTALTANITGNLSGSVGSVANLEQAALADAAVINCTVNTANFAGSTTTVACILTDRDAGAITAASNDLEGRELLILSGAQIYEGRFITDSTWDGANSELRLTLSRALPGTLADAVTAIIR